MITLQIAGVERQWESVEDVEESWVNQHFHRHNRGTPVCVVVRISAPSMDVRLSTPTCGSGGGGRLPNEKEKPVLELWQKWELGTKDARGGNLIAFLRQLKGVL